VSEEEKTAARMRGREETGREPGQPVAPPTPRRRLRLEDMDQRYRVEPMEAAPGQESETSWAYIRGIARADKLFAAVLVILALQVLMGFMAGSIFGAVIGGLILWGVLSLQWWGYWLALFGALVGLLVSAAWAGIGMAAAIQSGTVGLGLVYFAISAATNLFIALVLFTRRQHFG
jgi:hypothetical protein